MKQRIIIGSLSSVSLEFSKLCKVLEACECLLYIEVVSSIYMAENQQNRILKIKTKQQHSKQFLFQMKDKATDFLQMPTALPLA